MIDFPCRCGFAFSVPQDMAGESLQCPQCKCLVDVPLLSELDSLEPDGTIKVQERTQEEIEEQAAQLRPEYLPNIKSQVGAETYDLRPTVEDVINAGVEEIPLKPEEEDQPAVPKYDPETGQLVRPMVVKKEERPAEAQIPVAAPVIAYANNATAGGLSPWKVPIALFMPANIAVISIVFGLSGVVPYFNACFFIISIPLVIVALFMVPAHYSNIVEDIGVWEKDELPTPLRGMSLGEDVWHPFVRFMVAWFLCNGPGVVAFVWYRSVPAALSLAWAGVALFPAVFLTTSTSGTLLNLRPDRVLAVIRACGLAYPPIVVFWFIASTLSFATFTSLDIQLLVRVLPEGSSGAVGLRIALAAHYPLLFMSVYLMHLFCWYLGLLYRAHHLQFPWVLQRHIPTLSEEDKALRRHRAEQMRKKRLQAQRQPEQAEGESMPERIPLEP